MNDVFPKCYCSVYSSICLHTKDNSNFFCADLIPRPVVFPLQFLNFRRSKFNVLLFPPKFKIMSHLWWRCLLPPVNWKTICRLRRRMKGTRGNIIVVGASGPVLYKGSVTKNLCKGNSHMISICFSYVFSLAGRN